MTPALSHRIPFFEATLGLALHAAHAIDSRFNTLFPSPRLNETSLSALTQSPPRPRHRALLEAVERKSLLGARMALARGDARPSDLAAGLLLAARLNFEPAARLLIEAGAPIEPPAGSKDSLSPLLAARAHAQPAVFELLLALGANPNWLGESRDPPLAQAFHYPASVAALIKAGADPNAVHPDTGRDILCRWCSLAPRRVDGALLRLSITLLIEAGANLNHLDKGKRNALWWAKTGENPDLAAFIDKQRQRQTLEAATGPAIAPARRARL